MSMFIVTEEVLPPQFTKCPNRTCRDNKRKCGGGDNGVERMIEFSTYTYQAKLIREPNAFIKQLEGKKNTADIQVYNTCYTHCIALE